MRTSWNPFLVLVKLCRLFVLVLSKIFFYVVNGIYVTLNSKRSVEEEEREREGIDLTSQKMLNSSINFSRVDLASSAPWTSPSVACNKLKFQTKHFCSKSFYWFTFTLNSSSLQIELSKKRKRALTEIARNKNFRFVWCDQKWKMIFE